jgi:hypothetical protein
MLIIDLVKYNNKNSNSFSLSIIKIQNPYSTSINSAKSRLLFLKKNLKNPPYTVFKLSENFIRTIYTIHKILFITSFYFKIYNIVISIFPVAPRGGGACRFLYRDNNMMQIICKLLFVWRRKLVWSSSSRLCQTWHWSGCLSRILHDWMKTQKTTDQTIWNNNTKYWQATSQKFSSQEPRWNSSATTAHQFQVQHSYFWITL